MPTIKPGPTPAPPLKRALANTLLRFAALERPRMIRSAIKFEEPCACPPFVDRLLCFAESNWRGAATFLRPIEDLAKVGPIQSLRATPFVVELTYHVIADGSDFPGNKFDPVSLEDLLPQVVELEARIIEVHRHVRDIWLPYLLDLRKTRMFTLHWGPNAEQYFDLSSGELGQMAGDEQFDFDKQRLHCVITNGTPGIGIGQTGDFADGKLDHPVFAAEMRNGVFGLARTIAHEAGHALGLPHGDNTNPYRLMSQTVVSQNADVPLQKSVTLGDDEVEKVHGNLASNEGYNPGFRRESAG